MRAFLQLVVVASAALGAAEGPPPVPDPIGLGERLALIDHLREEYRLTPEPGWSLEDLRAAHLRAWRAAKGLDVEEARAQEAAVQTREETDRLRRRLADRFHQEADPGLDLASLKALLARLEAEKAAKDAAHIEARLRAPDPEPSERRLARAPTPPPAQEAAPEAPALQPAATLRVQSLNFRAPGVRHCRYFVGPRPLLGIQFGEERGREFQGVFEYLATTLAASTHGPRSAIILLGHGSGASIAGEAIDAHLRRWKEFYETLGGTRPAAPVECLVIASCSRGSPVQMGEIRDGLGYYPTWRVATADRTYANALTVIAAFAGAVSNAEDPPFRGIYRWGKGEASPASIAEVGRDGARGNLRYYDIAYDQGRISATER